LVALLNSTALKSAGILNTLNAPKGLKQITASQGITYNSFLQSSQFISTDETTYCNYLEGLLKNATMVYFFGQVYHDSNGDVGIHDIHEIQESGYGDGGMITADADNNYYGVFAHFNNQPGYNKKF